MPSTTAPVPSPARRWLLAAGVVAIVAGAGVVGNDLFVGDFQAPLDYTAFWTAGRLNAEGQNPYDAALVRQIQRELGWETTAIMMWNPPWTLGFVMPLGLLPFRTGHGIGILLNLGLVLLSAEWLRRGFGMRGGRRIAAMLALAFVPTFFLVGSGQITGIALLGLAGFLTASRAGRPWLAGAVGAATAVKPHLLGLFALWLLIDALRSGRGRRVVLAGSVALLVASVPPTLANPDVWTQYLAAITGGPSTDHHELAHWEPPLAGWWFRSAIPGAPFAVQFLPFALAAVGFAAWCWRTKPDRTETTGDRLPWIVGLSLLAAPYGVWQYDFVLLLVPILATAARLAARPTAAGVVAGIGWLAILNGVSLAMMLHHAEPKWYFWFTPAVLLGCAAVRRVNASDWRWVPKRTRADAIWHDSGPQTAKPCCSRW